MKKAPTKLVRTTIFLPAIMQFNLQVLALQTGESQATIIRLAIASYLKTQGYDPHKKPQIKVRY